MSLSRLKPLKLRALLPCHSLRRRPRPSHQCKSINFQYQDRNQRRYQSHTLIAGARNLALHSFLRFQTSTIAIMPDGIAQEGARNSPPVAAAAVKSDAVRNAGALDLDTKESGSSNKNSDGHEQQNDDQSKSSGAKKDNA